MRKHTRLRLLSAVRQYRVAATNESLSFGWADLGRVLRSSTLGLQKGFKTFKQYYLTIALKNVPKCCYSAWRSLAVAP